MKYPLIKAAFFAQSVAASTALTLFVAATPFSHANPTTQMTGITPAKTTPPASKPYISPSMPFLVSGEGTITADVTAYNCKMKYTISKDNAPTALPTVVIDATTSVAAYQIASLNASETTSISNLGDYTGLYSVKAYSVTYTPQGPLESPNFYSDGISTNFVVGYKIGIPDPPPNP